jgi:hypothetical protein
MYADVRKLHSVPNDLYVSLYSARYSLLGTPKYNYITKLREHVHGFQLLLGASLWIYDVKLPNECFDLFLIMKKWQNYVYLLFI